MGHYCIGEDPTCFWIGDANKFFDVPREFGDYRFCCLTQSQCPVVTENDECLFPKARKMGKAFDPNTMKKE